MVGSATALVLVFAASAVLAWGGPAIAGVPPREAVSLLLFGAVALWLTGWAVERSRPTLRDMAGAVVMWAIFVISLTAVYVRRDDVYDGMRNFVEELGYGPPAAIVSEGGEVTVTRRRDGHFRFEIDVNGKPSSFLFDTGASSVVLTAETAELVGFKPSDLRFVSPVQTANGRTMTAPVVIDRLAIGPIIFTRVSALVARPGLLTDNLLGQSVLGRLESYEVRGSRLVLRARKS
ncbi:retropepsin-like aspartic protease family protein [Enterovirga rhinocerotis]|uniref:Aspartyl protease family protein n=1 Tax=Enterovirga rhinocerotis TaxID=1339210 RepID=A0A4R7BWI5_9HYPH|nr:TIGR02281 family clan AA aspartic protease [Enterovirga rhinocerotis]TDR89931.1 aspartyl protease family protein [Enterovirga rhinocerotis]